jgi:hypothetical protein
MAISFLTGADVGKNLHGEARLKRRRRGKTAQGAAVCLNAQCKLSQGTRSMHGEMGPHLR